MSENQRIDAKNAEDHSLFDDLKNKNKHFVMLHGFMNTYLKDIHLVRL